ncbi:MAG: hypothetical protein ACTTH5_02050 [Wolinella sp.]
MVRLRANSFAFCARVLVILASRPFCVLILSGTLCFAPAFNRLCCFTGEGIFCLIQRGWGSLKHYFDSRADSGNPPIERIRLVLFPRVAMMCLYPACVLQESRQF